MTSRLAAMDTSSYYSVQRYSDPQDHARNLVNFDQDYTQIESGQFCSTLMQAELGGLRVYTESVSHGIVQKTHLRAGSVTLGWRRSAAASPGEMHQLIDPILGILRSGENWMLHLVPGTEICGLTLSGEEFDRLTEPLGLRIPRQTPVLININSRAQAALQWCLAQVERQARRLDSTGVRASLREHFLESVCLSLCEQEAQQRPDVTRLSYQQIVNRSQERALTHTDRPPSVIDLCTELRVSRRTLQNSFQQVIGQSPSTYLRCLRLGRVRSLLRASTTSQLSVGDAAAHWGFFHMGHFANDYRKLFGELPSNTARAR